MKTLETSFADKVSCMDLHCGSKESSVTPRGFYLGLLAYIAAEDAGVISVKPIQILPPFELVVGP